MMTAASPISTTPPLNFPYPSVSDVSSEAASTSIMKKCSKCGRTLPISEFERHNKAKDGYHRFCKECGSTNKGKKQNNKYRPVSYIPQPGNKATLTLADFTDENLFAELRRRGYNGELRFSKVITV